MTDLNTGWLNILNIDMYIVLFALKKAYNKAAAKIIFYSCCFVALFKDFVPKLFYCAFFYA